MTVQMHAMHIILKVSNVKQHYRLKTLKGTTITTVDFLLEIDTVDGTGMPTDNKSAQ